MKKYILKNNFPNPYPVNQVMALLCCGNWGLGIKQAESHWSRHMPLSLAYGKTTEHVHHYWPGDSGACCHNRNLTLNSLNSVHWISQEHYPRQYWNLI